VLGVPPDATETELHAAWRRQLKYWHPDRGNHPMRSSTQSDQLGARSSDQQHQARGIRPTAGSRRLAPLSVGPSYGRPVQWKTVSREGPPRAPTGFDRHGFVARLEEMMSRGRLMIEKRKDLASASKWESQTQALLRDELGDHPYTKRSKWP